METSGSMVHTTRYSSSIQATSILPNRNPVWFGNHPKASRKQTSHPSSGSQRDWCQPIGAQHTLATLLGPDGREAQRSENLSGVEDRKNPTNIRSYFQSRDLSKSLTH